MIPKKIIIIVENLPVPLDRRVWQEANTLKKEGYDVSVICPKGKGCNEKFEIINDIYIYRHSLPIEARKFIGFLLEYSCALFWEFFLSFKIFLKRKFDVIHACNPPDLIFLIGLFYKVFFKKKFVYDHHDIFPEMWLSKGGRKNFIFKFLLVLEKLTYKTADISIETSNSYKELALSRGNKKEDDVFIVRSSPDFSNYEPFINEENKLKLKVGKKFLVGYVGVMAIQDGVNSLLKAADYIINKKKRNDIYFVLIGDGPEWNNLVKYAEELEISNNIEFVGWKSGKEMVDLLSACDIGVCPEPNNEYNSKSSLNKVLEYMTLGIPIVQFDLEESRYLAQNASLYAKENDEIDFAKKILILLENEKLRQKMGELGKKRAEEVFPWKCSELELKKAYKYLFLKK